MAQQSAHRHKLAPVIHDTLGRRVSPFALTGPPAPSTLPSDDQHNPPPVQALGGLFVLGHAVPASLRKQDLHTRAALTSAFGLVQRRRFARAREKRARW